MEELSDEFLSDVHIYNEYNALDDQDGSVITRFQFTIPWQTYEELRVQMPGEDLVTGQDVQDTCFAYSIPPREPTAKRRKFGGEGKKLTLDDDGKHAKDVDPCVSGVATNVPCGSRHQTSDGDGDSLEKRQNDYTVDVVPSVSGVGSCDVFCSKQPTLDDDGDIVVERKHADIIDVVSDVVACQHSCSRSKQPTLDDDGDIVVERKHANDVDPFVSGVATIVLCGSKHEKSDGDGDGFVERQHADTFDVVSSMSGVGTCEASCSKQPTLDDDGDIVVERQHADTIDVVASMSGVGTCEPSCSKQPTLADDGDIVVERQHADTIDVVASMSGVGTCEPSCSKQPTLDYDGDIVVERKHADIIDVVASMSGVGTCEPSCSKQPTLDDNGDIVVKRRKPYRDPWANSELEMCVINIKHSLSTGMAQVGEQVWQGALLLCDYIIDLSEMFSGKSVVDLGAGTGLTSIVAAMYADHVYCTDVGENVLSLARHNKEAAADFRTVPRQCPIVTRELDWFCDLSAHIKDTEFGMDAGNVADIQKATILIAADVIYDNDITDAFFKTVKDLMLHPPGKLLLIGLERRLVFTIEDIDVSSPGYSHFRKHLDDLTTIVHDVEKPTFLVEQVDIQGIPQSFLYKRTKYLELWKISSFAFC